MTSDNRMAVQCAIEALINDLLLEVAENQDGTPGCDVQRRLSLREAKAAIEILEKEPTELTPTFTVYFPSGYRTDPHDIENYMHRNPTAWHRFAATDRYWAPALEVLL